MASENKRERYNCITGKWYEVIESASNFKAINVNTVQDFKDYWDNIPPRKWLIGDQILRQEVTVTTGPGGVGKTAVSYTGLLSAACGRNLFDPTNTNPKWKLHSNKPLKVYIYSLEDNKWEMIRRLKGIMNFHNLTPNDFRDTLFMGDGTVDRFVLANMEKDGVGTPPCVQEMLNFLKEQQIDILLLDPMVKSHTLEENSNPDMDKVMTIAKEIATRANCAIWFIHHSAKAGVEFDVTGSRGAGAIMAAARIGGTIGKPSQDEIAKFGFDSSVIRFNTAAKINLSAPSPEDIQYLRLRSQAVGNGDYVQVAELVESTSIVDSMDKYLFANICKAIRTKPTNGVTDEWVRKADHTNWIGQAMLGGGVANESHAKMFIEDWLKRGLLVSVDGHSFTNRKRALKGCLALDEDMVTSVAKELGAK